ncbi:MAG: protein translocase subunit SecD, partial [Bacillota bacterium]
FGLYQPVWDDINKGLDLVGGIHIVLEAEETDEPVTDVAMVSAMEVIRRRVDALGVTEPVIVREGARRIVVNLPGIKDPEEALEIIGRTARLEFTDEEGNVLLTGENLTQAQALFQRTEAGGQQPIVSLQFDAEGTRLFAEATREHLHRRIIILLDDEVVQAPYVRGVISDGRGVIEGYESLQEAQEIAVVLNSGALPVDLVPLRPQFVSATLGEASIAQSWRAAIIAVAAVVALMVTFYRVPGVWAVVALGLYIVLVLVALAGINATLTLPGIAGIILSIGMAVDANVIIFERIKEEVRSGATPRAAIDSGFTTAFRTILDANVTTLIAAGVLYWLASGPIRGFAVTLSLGIVVSMFTAMVITRVAMVQMAGAGLITEGPAFFGSRREQDE